MGTDLGGSTCEAVREVDSAGGGVKLQFGGEDLE